MYYFAPDKLEAYGDANYLKGGIVYADAVTTVSDTYAEEIKTPFYGERLDGLMRARSNCLRGIVNGIDYNEYNPETDKLIEYNYNSRNFRKEKIKNKRALQRAVSYTHLQYITIQDYRLLGKFTVNIQIEPEIEKYSIPRFILPVSYTHLCVKRL